MILQNMTWQEVRDISRDLVVIIPTGSLEQHGPHLPLFTDSLLVTAASEAVEKRLPAKTLLTPTLWLGMSGHHLAFSGSLSAEFDPYVGAITGVVQSLIAHGFTKFYILNGHGGNTDANSLAMRGLKARYPAFTFGHSGYFAFGADKAREVMTGPLKEIRHSCEAEVSLMMHLYPDQVRTELLRDDGLFSSPEVRGVVHHFDDFTEEGSFGYATLGTAEKGRAIFEACIDGCVKELEAIADGYVLESRPRD